MKKTILSLFVGLLFFYNVGSIYAQTPSVAGPTPQACPKFTCPLDNDGNPVFCEPGKDKWVYDPEVTALGKGGDRARQFIFWTINTRSFEDTQDFLLLSRVLACLSQRVQYLSVW